MKRTFFSFENFFPSTVGRFVLGFAFVFMFPAFCALILSYPLHGRGRGIRPHQKNHRMPPPKTYDPKSGNIVCYCQYHRMPMAVASYANGARPAVRLKKSGGGRSLHHYIPYFVPLAADVAGGHSTCHNATFCTVPPTLTT